MCHDFKEKGMKKNIIYSTLIISLLLGATQTTFADGMPYEPVFESEPISESTPVTTTAVSSQKTTPANIVTTTSDTSVDENKLQNALIQLDSAQVEIRNNLIKYKNEYSEIDNKYRVIQAERKAKKQQVKDTEKRIKTLEKTKEKIRKSM